VVQSLGMKGLNRSWDELVELVENSLGMSWLQSWRRYGRDHSWWNIHFHEMRVLLQGRWC